jgi:hypothetical protein
MCIIYFFVLGWTFWLAHPMCTISECEIGWLHPLVYIVFKIGMKNKQYAISFEVVASS